MKRREDMVIIIKTLLLYVLLAFMRGIPYARSCWREADKLYNAHREVHGRNMTDDERARLVRRSVVCSNAQGHELSYEQIRRLVR